MMAAPAQDLGRTQALQVWRDAQVQRELAQAQAAWQLRLRRLTRQRRTRVAVLLVFWALGVGCGILIASQVPWPPQRVLAPAAATGPGLGLGQGPALATPASPEASEPNAPTPEGDVAERTTAHDATPDPTPLQASNTQAAPEPSSLATLRPPKKGNQPAPARLQAREVGQSAETGRGAPASHPSVGIPTAPDAPGPSASRLQVLSVPLDGVAMVQTEPNKFRSFRVGDTLPDGSVLRKADALTGQIETQRP